MPKLPAPISTLAPNQEDALRWRQSRLEDLLALVVPIPQEWLVRPTVAPRLEPQACGSYADLIGAWSRALRWRQDLDDALSIMLAVALSTEIPGDQLFLMVVADASSGKTRFCDAMLVSDNCKAVENITGFLSGAKGREEDGDKDYSFLARGNKKTWITPEGDVVMKHPKFPELMSQQRRIFDGSTTSTYKNRSTDRSYTNLRTPWIMAVTPAVLKEDQVQLGDRFLRVWIPRPGEKEKRGIQRRVSLACWESLGEITDGIPGGSLTKPLREAYSLTGGYVDWLRETGVKKLKKLASRKPEERVLRSCERLGDFVADLRSRPHSSAFRDDLATKELPTRLGWQMLRLAGCLAIVLGKDSIDSEVLRRVRKGAIDSSRGETLEIVAVLYDKGEEGIGEAGLELMTSIPGKKLKELMRFLCHRDIGVSIRFRNRLESGGLSAWRYRLTARFRRLYEEVMVVG